MTPATESQPNMHLNLPIVDISPFMDWPSSFSTTATANGASPQNANSNTEASLSLTPSQASTTSTLRNALRHPGFFYLTGHSIPPSLIRRVLSLGRTFYESNTKLQKSSTVGRDVTSHNCDGARGWQDTGDPDDCTDWHEALDFFREIPPDEIPSHRSFKNDDKEWKGRSWPGKDGIFEGRNLWPGNPREMKEVYEGEYIPRMMKVGTAVMRAMGYALELKDPETLVRMTGEESFWCLRVMGYPPIPSEELRREINGEGCGEHSDYGCLTLLVADEGGRGDADDDGNRKKKKRGGLRVKVSSSSDRDGGRGDGEEQEEEEKEERWVDADPVEGMFVVNIGDMVERWTGGWAKSTRHKVVHEGEGYRISVPFFFEPAKDVVVRRLPEFGGGNNGGDDDGEIRYWDHLVSKTDGSFYRKVTW